MSRKHENFSYYRANENCGWYDASQYKFYYNGKILKLDNQIHDRLAYLCVRGKINEAENELKRLLRKEEKRPIKCRKTYCVEFADNNNYTWVKQLLFDINADIETRLYMYKEIKRYFFDICDGYADNGYKIEQGEFNPFDNNKAEQIDNRKKLSDKLMSLYFVTDKKELIFY